MGLRRGKEALRLSLIHISEAALINIPTVDGYIAQIWTGTSREANVYEGVYLSLIHI